MSHGTSCPKSRLKSTCLTAKFGSFLDHAETGKKGQNVISSSVQHPISLIFAIHVFLPMSMMWVLLTKPIDAEICDHNLFCSFARLKNKHMGVLGTNVAATMSWLHWSPVLGIASALRGECARQMFGVDSKIYRLTMVRRYAVAPKTGQVMLPKFVVYPSPTVPDHRYKSPKVHFNEVLHFFKLANFVFMIMIFNQHQRLAQLNEHGNFKMRWKIVNA